MEKWEILISILNFSLNSLGQSVGSNSKVGKFTHREKLHFEDFGEDIIPVLFELTKSCVLKFQNMLLS